MRTTNTAFGFALCFLLSMSQGAVAGSGPATVDVDAIVKAVMNNQYGTQYDAKHTCWTYTHTSKQGDDITYCMRPGLPELVETAKGKLLFISAANAYDIRDDNRYAYSQSQPGLMGAFTIGIDTKGPWTYAALNNAMEFGSGGYCGCNKASFVKLSNQGDYGWLFVSGGAWNGTVVADYSILMPRKGDFADISRIPQIQEGGQDIKYELKVASDRPGAGLFPLVVTKIKGNVAIEDIQVNFDSKKFAYVMPSAKR
ncbi:MAG: hypothetical protein AB1586_30955 [Pseudomonadota bacterium]|jgi:hypothetical protein